MSAPRAHVLAARLRGRVIQPGEPDYEPARRIWNGLFDKRPAFVVRCQDDQDVVAAVTFARDNGLPLEVFLCMVYYPADRTHEALRCCERYVAASPDQAGPVAVLGRVPEAEDFPPQAHGEPGVILLALFPGDPAEGERALRPLREVAAPIRDLSGTMRYTQAQQVLDADYPDGGYYYWKSVNVPALTDGLIARLTETAAAAPSPESTVDVWFQGGAMARVGEQETAFANRDAPYLLGIEGNWWEERDSAANIAWVRDTFAAMRAFSAEGVYLNFPGFLEEGEGPLREGYGRNHERLAAIKSALDPENLFRLNANIKPEKPS
jgi:hypothetical protein